MAEEIQHRTVRYLQDAHAALTGVDQAFGSYREDTDDAGLKTLFDGLASQTKSQAQRVEARVKALGGDTSGTKNFVNSILGKASELMNSGHDDYDKNTQNIIKAYSAEQNNRAMFESLIAWATAVNDTETANLGRQIQQESASSADQIFPHISRYAQTALANTTANADATNTTGYVS